MENSTEYYFDDIYKACSYAFKTCYVMSHLILSDDKVSEETLTSKSCAKENFREMFLSYVKDTLLLNNENDTVSFLLGDSYKDGCRVISPALTYPAYSTSLFDEELSYELPKISNRFLVLRRDKLDSLREEALNALSNWQRGLSGFRCDGAFFTKDLVTFIMMVVYRNNELAICGGIDGDAYDKADEIIECYREMIPENTFIDYAFNLFYSGSMKGKYLDNAGVEAIFYMASSSCKSIDNPEYDESDQDDEVIRPLALASATTFKNTSKEISLLYELSMNKELIDDYSTGGDSEQKPVILAKTGNIIQVDFSQRNRI